MRRVRIGEFLNMTEKQRNDLTRIIMEGQVIQKVQEDIATYFEIKVADNEENILIQDKIIEEAEESTYTLLLERTKEKYNEEFFYFFEVALKKFYNPQKMDKIFSKASKRLLKEIYLRFYNELRQYGIDFYKYISDEELYQMLSDDIINNAMDGKIEKDRNVLGAMYTVNRHLIQKMERAGGVENWIKEKGLTKKKSNNAFIKNILIEKITIFGVPGEEEKYGELLIKVGFDSNYLAQLIIAASIRLDGLVKLYEINRIKEIVIQAVGKIPIGFVLKIDEKIKSDEMLRDVKWKNIKVEELKQVLENNFIDATVLAGFITKMFTIGNRQLSEEEIEFIFENQKNNQDMLRVYFELAKSGLYDEEKIIQLHREEIEENNTENPYEQESKNKVTVSELLSFFNSDKVIAKMEGYCDPELEGEEKEKAKQEKGNFLNFYLGLLEADKIDKSGNAEQIVEDLTVKLQKGIDEGKTTYLLVAIELFEGKVLDQASMKQILSEDNQEVVIELYGKGIDDKTLLSLYKQGLVQEYIVELLYQELDEKVMKEKITSNEIELEDAVMLYFLGIVRIEQLGDRKINSVNWEQILSNSNTEEKISRISTLYKNGNIGFEEVKQLKELGLIGAKEAELILNQLDLEGIFMSGLTSEEGQGEKGKRKRRDGVARKEGIPLEERETFLGNLGFEPLVNVYGQVLAVAKGSFAGYRVYRDTDRNFGVIIFENENEGSSFIMHEAKAGEFINTDSAQATLVGSRSVWREKARTAGSVMAKSHSLYWAKNIIEAIVETSSTFKFDDEEERKQYVKDETKRLCEEHKDSIEYLIMIKQEQVAK